MKIFIRRTSATIFLALSLFGLGCGGGGSDQPSLGIVTGRVTMDDKPLGNVRVAFVPKEGRSSEGITDAEGKYELYYIRDTKGAKIGSHIVQITTVYEAEPVKEGGEVPEPPKEPLPSYYNLESTLTAEVAAGENVIDFPLTSK